MTIAAGFYCKNGVLLCADTQITGGGNITHEAKIISLPTAWGSVPMAYTGNDCVAATSTIQKCGRILKTTSKQKALSGIEKIVEQQYRSLVMAHKSEDDCDFSLLFALPESGKMRLYITSRLAVQRVDSLFACIGGGEDLASYLIGSTVLGDALDERDALSLASFSLACVKNTVPGCGGFSQFVFTRNDGRSATVWSFAANHGPTLSGVEWVERNSRGFDAFSRRLFWAAANSSVSDEEFKQRVKSFADQMIELRQDWRKRANFHPTFAELIKGGPRTRTLEDEVFRTLPKHDQKSRRPLRE